VVELFISPARKLPMRSVDSVIVEQGAGLVGDRYHGSRHRHVSMQSVDDLLVAAEEFGAPIDPALTRRNVSVSGFEIPTKPGERVLVGDVELEVVRIAAPCKLLDDDIGTGAKTALRRRAGTIFRVLSSGTLEIGNVVRSALL